MKVTATRITDDRNLKPCDVDQALASGLDGSGLFWLRVDTYTVSELESWLDRLDLTPFARNRLLKQGEITKVVPVSQGMIIDVRILPDSHASPPRQVALLCLKNLLIRFDPEPAEASDAPERKIQEFELMDVSTSGILCSVLLFEAKRVGRAVRDIRSDIQELDEQMDRDPGGVTLDQILDVKDRLLKLLSVAEEQLECFEAVTEPGSDALDFSKLKSSIRLLLSAAGSTERMAGRQEKRVADLRQRYDSHQQEKLNHRLAILTVLSAIFLPLTLIAGIWGMNFESMPELKYPLGYPVALGGMATIAAAMIWFFKRKGWFD